MGINIIQEQREDSSDVFVGSGTTQFLVAPTLETWFLDSVFCSIYQFEKAEKLSKRCHLQVVTVLCFCISLHILNNLPAYVSRLSRGLHRIDLSFSSFREVEILMVYIYCLPLSLCDQYIG